MNLIDIASYQQGMDLPTMFRQNPSLDGVISKVSQGTGYVNPFAKAWLDWLISNGKPAGTYHYLDTMGAVAEARHYVESVKPWIGKVVLAIDYEEGTLRMGTAYLKQCLDEVYRLTGVKPLVYCSQIQTLEAQDFSAIAGAGYRLWVAQYADNNPVRGFIANPWHTGTSKPFPSYTMRQYTSNGYLNGWNDNIDFDLFYGDASDWDKLTGNGADPEPTTKPVDPSIVLAVLKNEYGIGQERINKLRDAGYDPDDVQRKINALYATGAKVKHDIGADMSYLNAILWIVRSL